MKHIIHFVYFVFALMSISTASAINFNVWVSNLNSIALSDAPVVVKMTAFKKLSQSQQANLTAFVDGKAVSTQLDDLDRDGIPDELVFLIDLKAGEDKKVVLKPVKASKRPAFPKETDASLILKTNEGFKQVTEIASTKNDMYNKLHHHGVAFESSLIAYRIYFDTKSTIDIYGKKKPQLELAHTSWYPTDEQLAAGFGDDILLVSDWVGNGTVKGWDGTKATHIERFEKRTQRIVASGNLRTIVESEVKGWEYEGKKTDMTVRYILYARHRDVTAEVRASNDIQHLATGVQLIGNGPSLQTDQLVGSWGSWYPQPDTIKYAKETVGLGLFLPEQFNGKQQMAGVNNIILFPVKAGEVLRFHFTTVATKEENQTITTAGAFFSYLNSWSEGLTPLKLKIKK